MSSPEAHAAVTPFMQPEDVIPPQFASRLEIYRTTDPLSPEWQAAAEVEAQVFVESGYVSSAAELAEEYAPYIETSEMMGLRLRESGQIIGASRVADQHPENGHKTIHDIETGRLELHDLGRKAMEGVDLARTMSFDTIALEKSLRSSGSGNIGYVGLLYAAGYLRAANRNAPHIIASFDEKYWGGFHRRFAHFATDIGPAADYMGSKTVPVLIDVTKASLNDFQLRRQRKEVPADEPHREQHAA